MTLLALNLLNMGAGTATVASAPAESQIFIGGMAEMDVSVNPYIGSY